MPFFCSGHNGSIPWIRSPGYDDFSWNYESKPSDMTLPGSHTLLRKSSYVAQVGLRIARVGFAPMDSPLACL
jgi:hypothetical protein